jgi:hypothetical protein
MTTKKQDFLIRVIVFPSSKMCKAVENPNAFHRNVLAAKNPLAGKTSLHKTMPPGRQEKKPFPESEKNFFALSTAASGMSIFFPGAARPQPVLALRRPGHFAAATRRSGALRH